MNILITGAGGLLGHEVCQTLLKQHALTVLARALPQENHQGIRYLTCDLSQEFNVEQLPNDIDVIVHLAQSPFYREFPQRADHVFNVNCAATAKLLEYAAAHKVKHFIYTSTGSVYEPYQCSLEETNQVTPTSFYANSKLIAERLFAPYESYFKITILRLFFLYGPHPDKKQTIINNLLQRIQEQQEITIDGNKGGLKFVPTLTSDIAHCIEQVIEQGITGTINVANPQALHLEEAINIMADKLGVKPTIKHNLEKSAMSIIPNLEKMHTLLPNVKFTTFAEGVGRLIGATE
jgi:UDP-glucose 4-epimerase